ncbi:MAG: Smr/MutS family protein [Bacteroidales bacterium]|nr:Smr/MutS family protein [Bacteroidales bacterium]
MIYPDNFEEKLKFGKIRASLKELCLSNLGAEIVDSMAFSADYEQIMHLLQETWEMYRILNEEDGFALSEFNDLREALNRIRIEGLYLEEEELVALYHDLKNTKDLVAFFEKSPEEKYPLLKAKSAEVFVYPLLISRIESILDKYGRIKDSASPELARIRRDILSKQSSVSKRLTQILKQAQTEGFVDADATVTVRDGRAVIPVPAANKRRIGGIVLDESASGRTSFIEPTEVVQLNNELRELGYAERREVIRILTDVASAVRPYIDDILSSYRYLGYIDFVRAKAKYAVAIEAVLPVLENRQGMYWSQARHPLLYMQLRQQGKAIVPLDIELEAPLQRILIISGPNAGGKSVCLQTVGIVQYMLQCGMLVPVAEGSKMGIFDNIFIDMGDEQSIENDLSTYSSHLTNMKHFVRNASDKTLLLIDEFGTGTEPMLGGAIAESVLAELNRKGAFGVITTHYTNLKHFAAQTEGIHNGAMLFDTHAIQPLFRLQMGQPGSSFAFEIARKIGLPESILNDAKEKIGQDHLDFDKHLREIVRDKHYWENKRQTVKENEKRLAEVLERYNAELQNVKRERREILDKARRQSEELLAEANRRIENTIREIRESQAEKERTKSVREELKQFKDEMLNSEADDNDLIERKIQKIKERERRKNERRNRQQTQTTEAPEKQQADNTPIVKGDMVMIDNEADRIAEVLQIGPKDALVAIGNLQTTVKVSRLQKVSNNAARKQQRPQVTVYVSNVGDEVRERKLNFKPEIDVRGMRTDEALEKVSAFVDEALLCEQTHLRILHGKGNGILRQMIRQQLRSLPFVVSVGDEHVQFGGAGITIVELE